MRKITFIAIALVAAIILFFVLGRFNQIISPISLQVKEQLSDQSSLSLPFAANQQPQPSPSPTVPFAELTIPYLRDRDYTGQLGELRQYTQNSNYTSYLTSYSSDELQINGLLTQPNGEMPPGGWPAVVFVHGYIPPAQYRTTERYQDYVDYLARNGFVVFKIDLRGHGNSDGEASGAYFSGDYVIDTLNARAALQNTDFVNSDQVGLWGHSMAGNVVFRAGVADRDIPAVVIWAGAVYTYEDMQVFGIDDNSYVPPSETSQRSRDRQRLYDTHGRYDPLSTFWQQVVPTNYLDGVTTAFQISHAVNDNVVSIEYSRNLERIAAEAALNFELQEYQSGGHNFSGSAFGQAMGNTVDFYNRNLK